MTQVFNEDIAMDRADRLHGRCTCGGMKRDPMPCDWCLEYQRIMDRLQNARVDIEAEIAKAWGSGEGND